MHYFFVCFQEIALELLEVKADFALTCIAVVRINSLSVCF